MELILIDSVKFTYAGCHLDRINEQLLLDTDTGVVYFSGSMQPRYDADGRVMVIPRDQLPGVIARARAQISAKIAEENEREFYLRFMQD